MLCKQVLLTFVNYRVLLHVWDDGCLRRTPYAHSLLSPVPFAKRRTNLKLLMENSLHHGRGSHGSVLVTMGLGLNPLRWADLWFTYDPSSLAWLNRLSNKAACTKLAFSSIAACILTPGGTFPFFQNHRFLLASTSFLQLPYWQLKETTFLLGDTTQRQEWLSN